MTTQQAETTDLGLVTYELRPILPLEVVVDLKLNCCMILDSDWLVELCNKLGYRKPLIKEDAIRFLNIYKPAIASKLLTKQMSKEFYGMTINKNW